MYQKDLEKINQRLEKLITDYADAYNKNALTDEVSRKLMTEMFSIEQAEVNLHKATSERISKALSPTVAARYMQIESKIRALIRYQLALNVPLVP